MSTGRIVWAGLSAVFVAAVAGGCGGGSSGSSCDRGTEGCLCNLDGTCQDDLTCEDDVCVGSGDGTAGTAGTTGAAGAPGTSGAAGDAGAGGVPAPRCDVPQASGDNPMIDDLEDGDGNIIEAEGRRGTWYFFNDETAGATQNPTGEFAPASEGADGTDHSARTWGEGFNAWGALMAVALNQPPDELACPYDASAYDGIQFYARGDGLVQVGLGVSGTVPPDVGGTCDPTETPCYDIHAVILNLSSDWTLYQITWDQVTQWGWGNPVEFDPADLVEIEFLVGAASPFDFYIDELSFIESGTGAGGAPGAGSMPELCALEQRASEGSGMLIDDLEDGDGAIESIDGRRGAWFVANDGGAGEQNPLPGTFVTAEDGANGTSRSARTWGEGFTSWGANLGFVINNPLGNLQCGYDACLYEGISFYLKGTGRVRVGIGTRPTIPEDWGGTCSGSCFDKYGKVYELTDEWTYYEIAWDDPDFEQAGWGTEAEFDPAEITGFEVQTAVPGSAFDIYLDEVSFYGTGPCAGGGAGGAGGMSGIAGAGGESSIAGAGGIGGAAGSASTAGGAGGASGAAGSAATAGGAGGASGASG